jgi:hypothetical protein
MLKHIKYGSTYKPFPQRPEGKFLNIQEGENALITRQIFASNDTIGAIDFVT